jgi:hypothetical protein
MWFPAVLFAILIIGATESAAQSQPPTFGARSYTSIDAAWQRAAFAVDAKAVGTPLIACGRDPEIPDMASVCKLTLQDVTARIGGRDARGGYAIEGAMIEGRTDRLDALLAVVEIVAAMLEPAYASHPRRGRVRPLVATQTGSADTVCRAFIMAAPIDARTVRVIITPASSPVC